MKRIESSSESSLHLQEEKVETPKLVKKRVIVKKTRPVSVMKQKVKVIESIYDYPFIR